MSWITTTKEISQRQKSREFPLQVITCLSYVNMPQHYKSSTQVPFLFSTRLTADQIRPRVVGAHVTADACDEIPDDRGSDTWWNDSDAQRSAGCAVGPVFDFWVEVAGFGGKVGGVGREDRRFGGSADQIGWILRGTFLIGRSSLNRIKLILGSEKEKFDLAVWISIILTLVFAYDGVFLGLPHVDFWLCLVLPHTLVGFGIAAVVWRKGFFHSMPTTYIIGFAGILVLATMHQQAFIRQQQDWRGILFKAND